MHQITSIENISREDLQGMAHAAAENGETLATANKWEPGTDRHRLFEHEYLNHQSELADAVTA